MNRWRNYKRCDKTGCVKMISDIVDQEFEVPWTFGRVERPREMRPTMTDASDYDRCVRLRQYASRKWRVTGVEQAFVRWLDEVSTKSMELQQTMVKYLVRELQ